MESESSRESRTFDILSNGLGVLNKLSGCFMRTYFHARVSQSLVGNPGFRREAYVVCYTCALSVYYFGSFAEARLLQ